MQSLAHQFLTFCRSKPADEAYNFCDSGNCAFAQFLRDNGYTADPFVDPLEWRDGALGKPHELPAGLNDVLNPWGQDRRTFTFGALADRLEAHLSAEA